MIAASFGAALLGAVVGGLISLVTAKSSLQETAQLNRKQKFDEEQRQAASRLAASITRALLTAPATGTAGAGHDAARLELGVAVAGYAPALDGMGATRRIEAAGEMLERDPIVVADIAELDETQTSMIRSWNAMALLVHGDGRRRLLRAPDVAGRRNLSCGRR